MTTTFPKYLNRLVDFCCDHNGNGCGHHIDGHGYGNECNVPGCGCRTWRDHTVCDHRTADPLVEVERLHELRDAAIAWRRRVAKAQRAGHRWTAGPQHWADGTDVALIAAVDALDTAGTAPAAGGEAAR